jgi:FixJ family two-component response regulator
MIEVVRGRLSKQIAGHIGIAEATVKVHRSRAMRKMNARSLSELGRMVDKLKLAPEKLQHF